MNNIYFIPGMWSGSNNFSNFKSYFTAKGYNCHTPVLKYHNIDPLEKPDPRLGSISIKDYVDDLEKEYKALGNDSIIIAHSMGGLLGQLLAARVNPKSLILLSSAPPLGISALSISVVKSFIGIFLTPLFWRRGVKISLNRAKYAFLNNLENEMQISEYNKLVYESGRAILEIGIPFLDPNKYSRVNSSDIKCPVLVLHGELDRIVPCKTGIKLAQKYNKTSTLKIYKDRAHLMELEDGWEDVAEYIYSWLQHK